MSEAAEFYRWHIARLERERTNAVITGRDLAKIDAELARYIKGQRIHEQHTQ